MLVISNRPRATRSADLKSSPDYSLNCTPLSPITITNCGNNKMLESDWFLTALIYCLIWLVQHQTVRFDLSDY